MACCAGWGTLGSRRDIFEGMQEKQQVLLDVLREMRLGRDVAVKVLPAHLAADPERRQRFEREARAVSSLNHPHICTLYDIGRQDSTDFLVMECLEGATR